MGKTLKQAHQKGEYPNAKDKMTKDIQPHQSLEKCKLKHNTSNERDWQGNDAVPQSSHGACVNIQQFRKLLVTKQQ